MVLSVSHPVYPKTPLNSVGIGYEVSRWFARMGCHVIMVNRKEDQGGTAIEKIKAECKKEGTEAKIEWVGCDLGSLKMVKEVMTGIRERLDRLDLVGQPGRGHADDSSFSRAASTATSLI